jgi:signal transduction histidine kinase
MNNGPCLIRRTTIGLLALLGASLSAAAPQPTGADLHYRVWTTEEGLPQGSVRAIAQTPDGYIWIATFDGLVRFDGVRMTIFTRSDFPEMTSNRCLSLLVDRQGRLWVGTEDGGVLQRVGTRFRSFGRSSGLESDAVHSLAEDEDGRLWAWTSAGYEVFDGSRWKRADEQMPKPAAWRTPPSVLVIPAVTGSPERRAWTTGANGRVWALDSRRLYRRDGESWHAFSNPVPEIVSASPVVYCLFEDREGTLWIGGQQGLVQASPTPVRAFVPDGSPDQQNVYTLSEDASGRVWVGTQTAPLVWERGAFRPVGQEPWWPRESTITIEVEADGTLLAGHAALFRIWPGKRFEKLRDRLFAVDVLRDRRGVLWLATPDGLLSLTADRWDRIAGLPSKDVRVLLEARDGALWVGTYGGLARVEHGTVRTWTTADGLSSDRIRALFEDDAGALWIGTYDGGLNRFAGGPFVPIRKRDGLYDDGVFVILDDGAGRYWMSSNRGIYSVARRELDAFAAGAVRRVSSRAWRSVDGMPSSEANGGRQPSGFRAADGTLWFPTQKGIAVIDPRAARDNPLPPPIVVEEITTDRRTIPVDTSINLQPGERRLEVHYTANTFIRPDGVRFRHRLVPYDDDWVEAGGRRFAQYGNIPPGRYRLTILAANSDGVWTPDGVSLAIRVAPYWWQTTWFRFGAGLLVVGAFAAAYERRVSALKRRRAEQDAFARRLIESQEAERKRIASELHDGIGQALVVIRNRAVLGLNEGAAGEHMTEISAAAGEAIDDVRRVAYGLRPQQLDRLGLKRALVALVEQTAKAAGIPIDAQIGEVDGLIARDDEINLYRIVQEALANVVRHARPGRAGVTVTVGAGDIEVRIEDDGAGFEPGPGGGLGLTGIAERARILGGRASVRSNPGHGTAVVVHVPHRGVSSGR